MHGRIETTVDGQSSFTVIRFPQQWTAKLPPDRNAAALCRAKGANCNHNGLAGTRPEMAVRLSIAFGTSAESWLSQQLQYDLWHAERNRTQLHVEKLSAA
jgi:hypothetical protein